MSCNHKRVWEMEDTGKEDAIKELLKDGYEPFGCFREKYWEYGEEYKRTVYCFKRLKPCEECKRMQEEADERVRKANAPYCVYSVGHGYVCIAHRYGTHGKCVSCGRDIKDKTPE